MLQMVSDAFGIDHERRTKASLLRQLFEFLWSNHNAGKRTLLLVDEVQNLPPRTLETLRTLSNLHSEDRSLLQIILLGQAEFRETLNAPELQQLRQRVLASCHLLPLGTVAETQAYIEHRLRRVGWKLDPVITDAAYKAIHEFTQGTPRRINTFCDRLLLYGFLEDYHTLSEESVAAVISEISSDFPGVSRAVEEDWSYNDSSTARGRVARLEKRITRLEAALASMGESLSRALSAPADSREEYGSVEDSTSAEQYGNEEGAARSSGTSHG
jgi:hypothetical protein